MKVLIFSPTRIDAGTPILKQVESVVGAGEVKITASLNALSDRLREPFFETPVAVLAAETEEDLDGLLSMAALLSDVRTILILPDSEDSTVAKGHSLRPRVVGWGADFLSQVPAIVEKMLASPQTNGKRGENGG